ncbi:MAG: ABC transporter permease [Ancalomicrobiaceae bacterium]|nr:ABC transporter permease [Ancalomicrobiaceae bacterium]
MSPKAGIRRAAGSFVAPGTLVALVAVIVILLAAAGAPILSDQSPLDQDLTAMNGGPTAEHLLGTDNLGRDVLVRLLWGARTTLVVGALGTALAFALGAGVGLMAIVAGRLTEMLWFAVIDLIRALPATLLGVLLIVALGSGTVPVIIALGLSFSPLVALVVRTAHAREVARDYVAAAASFGGGRLHVLVHHILPNLIGTLVTQGAIVLPRCIVTESVLSFLGLGSSPDEPTWGRMIADASRFIEQAPHAILAPVIALIVLTTALSVLGDQLRRRLDPTRAAAMPADLAEASPIATAWTAEGAES